MHPPSMVDRELPLHSPPCRYPHEQEILFAPLTGLEVRGTRVEGSLLVVEAKPSVNLISLTIEQVNGTARPRKQASPCSARDQARE